MTTSQPLQQTDLFGMVSDCPTSSSARRRARISAAPTPKAKASTASGPASTSKPSASLTNADLVGSLLKIALISELEAQTGSSMRWRQSATPAGHSWLVLETSAPTTNASEAGLSGSRLPTPMASDGMQDGKGGVAGSTYPMRMVLTGMLPTPWASDSSHGPEITKAKSAKTTGVSLVTTMAMGAMPTPRASDMKAGGHGDTGRMGTVRHQLHQAHQQLETLPTPTKRDKRLDSWSPAYDRRKSPTMDAVMDGAMTGRAADKWAGARALADMLRSHGLTGTAALPITYGWMMGYPPGWLSRALQSAVREGLLQPASSSKRSATPSARKSRKPSDAQS